MKNYYLLGFFTLFLGLIVSCDSDDDDASGVKRLTKIEELYGDDDYLLYSYNSEGKLISIEDGDDNGIHERVTIAYDGESINGIQVYYDGKSTPYRSMTFRYKEDSVFVSVVNEVNVSDTLIIDTSLNTLKKLIISSRSSIRQRIVTYDYDDRGNIIYSSNHQWSNFDYDTNPSYYSTVGSPYWFLNYLFEISVVIYEYAGPNNMLKDYSYDYGADGYPIIINQIDGSGNIERVLRCIY